jgi:hypothetical protein
MSGVAVTRASWYRFGSADAVFLLLCLLIFPAARGKMLSDPGLGWHLRNIDAMIAAGGWLTTDPFSQPRIGVHAVWYTNQWLGELPFWLGDRLAGLEGIAAVATVVLAFTLRCVYTTLMRGGLPWPLAAAWLCVAAIGTNCSWIARPNLFTMLFVFWTANLCMQFHRGEVSWRGMLWLLPLFAVWANTHGGFFAGFIILGVTLFVETLIAFFGARTIVENQPEAQAKEATPSFTPQTCTSPNRAAQSRLAVLGPIAIGAFLATLLNPYGWRLYPWIFQLLGDRYFMSLHSEWKPPPFNEPGGYLFSILILLLPLVLGLSKRRPDLVELGLSIAWLHFALSGFRYFPLWVLIAVPVMARSSLGIPLLEMLFALRESPTEAGETAAPPPQSGWAWTASIAVMVLGASVFIRGSYARIMPAMIPTDALAVLLKRHDARPDAVVFHSYDWGGYLTWHGWHPSGPSLLNWIDDRNEVQGHEHVEEYFTILDAGPGWEAKLDRDLIELIAIEAGAPLAQRLQKLAAGSAGGAGIRQAGGEWQWHLVYSDEKIEDGKIRGTVILERELGRDAK